LSESDKKSLADIHAKWNFLQSEICRHSQAGIGVIYHAQTDRVSADLAAGKGIEVASIQSREQLYEASLVLRKSARAAQAALSIELFRILQPFCELVRDVARSIVPELEKQERGHAGEFGFEFRPSAKLAALIWFAVDGFRTPVANHMHGTSGQVPDADWFGVALYKAPKQDADAFKTTDEQRIERAARDGRDFLETARSRAEVDRDRDLLDKTKKVAELSAQNDAFRAEFESFRKQHAKPPTLVRLELPPDEP
jgi:hypothetical protein